MTTDPPATWMSGQASPCTNCHQLLAGVEAAASRTPKYNAPARALRGRAGRLSLRSTIVVQRNEGIRIRAAFSSSRVRPLWACVASPMRPPHAYCAPSEGDLAVLGIA